MKKLLMASVMVLSVGAWAQEGVQEFQQNFAYGLRVAEMPCPKELAPKFPKPTCYLHGYDDFFDFKDAATPYLLDSGMPPLEPWHVVPMTFGSETVEIFRARYRLRDNSGPITLTYISENLLVLETQDVRASP